jgi:Tfp pilus assembly protein FimT
MAAPALLANPAMLRPDRRASAGFSFLEVVVTCALIAIVYAAAVPRFAAWRGPYAARTAASQIASAFQAARMRAIATNSNVRFGWNASTQTYTVQRQSPSGWVTYLNDQLPTGATITAPGTTPQFSPTGLLNGTFTIPVTAYGSTRTVTINVLGQTTIS